MKCTFMHKCIPVVDIEIDDASGSIKKIGQVFAPEHIPIGVPIKKGIVDRKSFNDWWTDRSIPASRSGIRNALETLDISNTHLLIVQCYGLSLSDQYWICPKDSGLSWNQVNFFGNAFSDDIGDVLFGKNKIENAFNFSSPDNTSDGNLKKRWKIIDGKRYLVKGGSAPFCQQPFNEVIAADIMDMLNISHIKYTVLWDDGYPYSICEDFVDENTELIPAWRILQTQKKNNSESVYSHFIKCCEELGIYDIVPFLDRMIVLDYIIANEDRHFNNFGVLRDPVTLKWIGMAPIYDSGSSLGYDKTESQIRSGKGVICKPFKTSHDDQLKLVSSFDWVDFDKLSYIENTIRDVFEINGAAEYVEKARINAIADSVKKRIHYLEEFAENHTQAEIRDTRNDVAENIAKSYL